MANNNDVRTRDCTLFIGAEGVSELGHPPPIWCREATPEEIEQTRQERALGDARSGGRDDKKDHDDWIGLFTDGIGRPYFLMTVTREAPIEIWIKASSHLRVKRLED